MQRGRQRVSLGLDANEHIYKEGIGKALTDPNGLGMDKVVGKLMGKQIGTTVFQGNRPINGV